ncbi:MAG: hypothetical protein JW874_01535 [Spirochaetales bacterium]|nr:hypothetical protein [Spirochaetales bacterium]
MDKIEGTGFRERYEQLLAEGNYIAAYSNLKEEKLERNERNELAGLMVNDILKDLDAQPAKNNPERRKVLRSLLLWIFRDYPGLAQIYKSQIRAGASENRNLLSLLGDLSNPETAKERVSEEMDNLMDNVRQNLDDTAEDIKSGRAQDKVRDFIDQAETNIREGIRNLADIFESLNKNNKNN